MEDFEPPAKETKEEKKSRMLSSKEQAKKNPPRLNRTKSITLEDKELPQKDKEFVSIMTEKTKITPHQLKRYFSFTLEVKSFKLFVPEGDYASKKFYVRCDYNKFHWESKAITYKEEWDLKFTEDIAFSKNDIKVKLFEKGGFFQSDSLYGEGSISLLEKNCFKMILDSKDKG